MVPVSPSKRGSGEEPSPPFAVSKATDEEREAMISQQRAKWGADDKADGDDEEYYGDDGFEEEFQEKEGDVVAASGLPRTNSESEVLKKLKDLEGLLGVDDDGDDEGAEEDNENGTSDVLSDTPTSPARKRSFTEKWLGKAADPLPSPSSTPLKNGPNAHLVFLSKGGVEPDGEGSDDEESEDEVSPPTSPTKAVAAQYVEEVMSAASSPRPDEVDDDDETDDEEEVSPPCSLVKGAGGLGRVTSPGGGGGEVEEAIKRVRDKASAEVG